MLIGVGIPAHKGQMPEQGSPGHAIELRTVELTPPSGPSFGTAHPRQMGA